MSLAAASMMNVGLLTPVCPITKPRARVDVPSMTRECLWRFKIATTCTSCPYGCGLVARGRDDEGRAARVGVSGHSSDLDKARRQRVGSAQKVLPALEGTHIALMPLKLV